MRSKNPDADTIDQAVDEPDPRPTRHGTESSARFAPSRDPLDVPNINYAVGDIEVEDGQGSYIPVRDLTDFLMQETYDDPEPLIDDLQKIARVAKVIEMPKAKRLSDRDCVPCRKGTPALDSSQAHDLLVQLGQRLELYRRRPPPQDLPLQRFRGADRVCEPDRQNRRGRVDIIRTSSISWGKCMVELWTHAIGGLTENDFILASKVEAAS